MVPHTITPDVGVVSCCKAKVGLWRSARGLHTRKRLSSLLRLNLDSSLGSIPLQSSFLVHGTTPKGGFQWVAFKSSTRNGRHDPKCPSARCLRMVLEDTEAPSKGATCAWMAAYEAVGFTRSFLTMWRSSPRLVCRGLPEPGLRVNDISWIHWSQHLFTTESERPN
ncbi:uncharacterized protein TNCV_1271021 [Trichonephila clavipes]|nr:uncharacterized protein TNCV_1271021 [Trichonephila clavipes]